MKEKSFSAGPGAKTTDHINFTPPLLPSASSLLFPSNSIILRSPSPFLARAYFWSHWEFPSLSSCTQMGQSVMLYGKRKSWGWGDWKGSE